MMWGMWLVPLAVIGAIVWLITDGPRSRPEEPVAALKRRLAGGEISEDEYARLRNLLQ